MRKTKVHNTQITSPEDIRLVTNNSERKWCERPGHVAISLNCPARKVNCRKCSKWGHFEKMCKTKGIKRKAEAHGLPNEHKRSKFVKHDNVRQINEYDTVFNIQEDSEITCTIGGVKVSMIIDSGSEHTT